MNLIQKYKPKTIRGLIISKEKIMEVKRLIAERKPIIIAGPTGCGKTTLAHIMAKDMDYELLELNASDQRNKANIEEILSPAIKEASLFAKGRLVLIDDIDALSGTQDRGGIPSIANLLENTKWPVLLTTTDPFSQKLSPLRTKTALVNLEPIKDTILIDYLSRICKKENIAFDIKLIKNLASKNKGDIRAALNDLQASIKNNELISLELGERERLSSITTALSLIFRSADLKKILNSLNETDLNLDEAMLWLDENIPKEYTKKDEIYKAYSSLSKADKFKKRIIRWQHWRFLVYENFFMTAGINLSRTSNILSYPEYKRSSRLLKYFWANQRNLKGKEIARKISEKTHDSISKVRKEVLPLIKIIYRNNNEISDLDLTQEEIDWLKSM